MYDIAFVGNYTKDTIVSAAGTRIVDGGAFNYGAHVAAQMRLRTVAVTRLAGEDWRVVDRLARLGVDVHAERTLHSTCLRLEYPTANVDERVIYVTSTAGSLTPQQATSVPARAFVVGASFRGEAGLDLFEGLAAKGAPIAADVQGFVRVVRDGKLVYEPWPAEERQAILSRVGTLKTDAVEAEMLTGTNDIYRAAQALTEMGPAEIVLTHRGGLLVYAGGRFHEAGFFPARLVGRSGRGDTCLGAYVSRRLASPPAEATIWAAAVTSLKMEAEGPFLRTIPEVEALIWQKYSL